LAHDVLSTPCFPLANLRKFFLTELTFSNAA
jgi:hypothetical protein